MEPPPSFQHNIAVLARAQSYFSVAETGDQPVNHLSFQTGVTRPEDMVRFIAFTLDALEVLISSASWSQAGMVIDFQNLDDLSLFALAYDGPNSA